jgi:small-conductance mechanosensitive channel
VAISNTPRAVLTITVNSPTMKSTRLTSGPLRWVMIAGLLTASVPVPAHAQISSLKKAAEAPQPAKPTAPEKPEDIRARLAQWLQDARDTLARLEASGTDATLPEGISTEELEDRRRDLEQMILTSAQSIKNLTAIADARKTLETSRAADAAWSGFKEKPPYSLVMLDELLNEHDALQINLTSYESSLSNFQNLLASIIAETKSAAETVSSMLGAVQNADDSNINAAKWRLEAARAKSRLLAARASLLQSRSDSLKDRIAGAKTELSLLDRKVKTASANSRFNDADLAKIKKISDERKLAIRKEITGISKRLKTAMSARDQAQSAVDALVATTPADKESEGLELARFKLDMTEWRVEALQSLIEGLDSLTQLENVIFKAHQGRQAIIGASNIEVRNSALESLKDLLERILAWENIAANDITSCEADLSNLESRAASITSEEPRFNLLSEQRVAKSEKLAMLKRISQAVISQRKLIQRWVTEYSPNGQESKPFARLSTLGAAGWGVVKEIWAFKVMAFEDTVEVDGQTITGKFPITLGLLLRALLFFVIGYGVFSRIANRIQAGLVTRGHIAEAQAKTLRNWAMIVVGVFLALGTLAFLKIPLTVFALFGGALAIGLGFGMQTLIKNFISGIIVLAERKVRVGDMLDVDGIVGTVTEINTRSSVIRGPDDAETMIPNSAFLENRVTNWTLTHAKMRRSLRVGVAYGTSPQKVMETLTESAGRHGLICKDPAPFAVFDDFGENSLVFSLYFWLDLRGATNAMIVTSDLRLMIEKRFAELDIAVPFPQRTLHLNAGQPLQVQWAKEPESNTWPPQNSK